MADADAVTRAYLEDNATFADAFNFLMFEGRQVIKPEDLTPLDPNELTILDEGDEKLHTAQKYRDLLKKAVIKRDGRVAYMLLGIESQSSVHYAMPIRCMLYDAMRYDRQVKMAAQAHRNEVSGRGASFLSGFHKTDSLLPVFTLVLYFGPDPWDGPRDLYSMLDIDPELLPWIDNYHLRLIEPAMIQDEAFGRFHSELNVALRCIKYAKDKQKIRALVQKEPAFHNVSRRTVELVNVVTKSRIPYPKREESVDMCEAIDGIFQDGVEEGIGIGVERGIGIGREEGILNSLANLMKSTHWGIEQAMEALGIPPDLRERYASLLAHRDA